MVHQVIEGYRLSPQQRQLWLRQPAGTTFRAQCAVLLEGSLKIEALQKALEIVIERHEILRTTFQRQPGMTVPLQVIGESYVPSWRTVDLTQMSRQDQTARVEEEFRRERDEPFDLAAGPTLRVVLLSLSASEHVTLIGLPALCADAWTLKNLVDELNRCYAAAVRDEDIAQEVVQYLQFSEWQHHVSESTEDYAAAGRSYWRNQGQAAPPLRLPIETQPGPNTTFAPATLTLPLDPRLNSRIEAVATAYEADVSDFILSSWLTLLWRLSGQSDISVSTLISGRKLEELDQALGLFVLSVPLRAHVSANMRLSEILRAVHEAVHGAKEWQEYYTGEADTDLGQAISFSCVELGKKLRAEEVNFSLQKLHVRTGDHKLRLSYVTGEQTLAVELEFDTRAYEREAIERLGRHFEVLIKSAIANPEAAVGELEILADKDLQQLIVSFNQTEAEYPREDCIHQLFEAQVRRSPENVAVVFGDQHWTFAEVNQQANQLAHYLRSKGVGPETCIGISLERSEKMVVGLLGILKAGAAYIPLDPDYPGERLSFMLQDAAVPVLLTQQRLAQRFTELQAELICLDADWDRIAEENPENLESGATKDNLAYVIYTSGSTGRPKGVMIPHQGLVNYLNWCVEAYQVADGCGSLVHSSIGFDLTITSLFAPLLAGRSVLLLPENPGIEGLAAVLREGSDFSLIKITPAHLEAVGQVLPAAEIAGRTRVLVIGGEALWAESLSLWREFAPVTRIINEYGPTETVVGCCIYEIPAGTSISGPVPIGSPIANTQIYLLDQHLRPVPIGVPGELYIGGDGLARGYLNRPDLTAEYFIANPFGRKPGERLYKTGDLARRLRNGEIEYLGRLDGQVKIRGFRIELGEIEAVLLSHSSVRQSVVLAREDAPGDKRLVAYIVAREGVAPAPGELRTYLQQKLPDYMLPFAFVLLEEMPLTQNGKVDRSALPEPDHSNRKIEAAPVAPRTALEEVIARMWADLLKVEQVGIHDDFFELGGHSLLATRLVSRSNEAFRLQLPVQIIFETPTIAGMVESMLREEKSPGSLEEIALFLKELDTLSEAEAEERLAAEGIVPEPPRPA